LDVLEISDEFLFTVNEREIDGTLEGHPDSDPIAEACDPVSEKLAGDMVEVDVVPFK
jgi:hypothetical protein